MFVLGVDIGGTWTRTGLVNRQGELSSFKKTESGGILQENGGLAPLIAHLKNCTQGVEVCAIAIGVPATVNKERTHVLSATFLHVLDGINIAEVLGKEFGVPIFLERDVNFLLTKDLKENNFYHLDCVCAIYYGTGIGNAVYINGSLLTGKHGVAAELGHIPLWKNTERCGCGNIGCVESVTCGKALQKIHRRKYPQEPIEQIFSHYERDEELGLFVDTLALTAATEINIFDPDLIVLGGGLLSMAAFPKKSLEAAIFKYTRKPYPAEGLNFYYTGEAQDSGVIGGGLYAWNKLP